MKKITLLLAFLAFTYGYAQDTCLTALTITAGTHTVTAVDGTEIPNPECAANAGGARTAGEWYSFTATVDGYANVTSDLPANAGGDTRFHAYEGACGSLTCVGGNDDVDGTNFLSNGNFPITAGNTYLIAWDDRWSAAGFDFTLTENTYTCPNTYPYTDDASDSLRFEVCYSVEDSNSDGLSWTYNGVNDFNGDGINDPIMNVFPPNPTLAKDDWLFTNALPGSTTSEYTITINYNSFTLRTFGANESFEIVASDGPSSTDNMTVLGTFNNITPTGTFGDTSGNDPITLAYSSTVTYTPTTNGDFHIGIHATTPIATSDIFFITNIEVTETLLSTTEFDANSISHFFNEDTQELILNSTASPFSNIEIYNILGQQVTNKSLSQTNEVINMSSYTDGIYLAKVSVNGAVKTIKVIKR